MANYGNGRPELIALANIDVPGRLSIKPVSHDTHIHTLTHTQPPRNKQVKNRVGKKGPKHTSISLITIQIQLIRAGGSHDLIIHLHGLDPRGPATAALRIRPPAIRLQHATKPQHPGGELDVDERDAGTQEERSVHVRRVDKLADPVFEFLSVFDLFLEVLFLEEAVEAGDYVAAYLEYNG